MAFGFCSNQGGRQNDDADPLDLDQLKLVLNLDPNCMLILFCSSPFMNIYVPLA